MNLGLPIGLPALSDATRRRISRDAWLLTAWWLVVGLACSTLLLDVAGVRSPLWRYPLTALVMYALGVVAATRAWLALFGQAVQAAPGRYRAATDDERRSDLRPRPWPAVAAAFVSGPAIVLALLELMGAFDLGRAILWALIGGAAIAVLVGWACSRLPAGLGSDMLMAELALRFVFGRSIGREVLPPLPRGESWPMIVRETWVQGFSFFVLSAAVGAAMALARPDAVVLRDLLR